MSNRHLLSALALALLAASPARTQQSPGKPDPLAPLHVLEGTWQGESEGFGQTSSVTHEWKRVLGGNFMRLATRSASKGKDGSESVHEDLGYVSWSKSERVLRFRQFLSEGFVNTFRITPADKPARGFNFEPESTEGYENMAARMTLRFDEQGGYDMVLELGTKGRPLKPCQVMKLRKVRPGESADLSSSHPNSQALPEKPAVTPRHSSSRTLNPRLAHRLASPLNPKPGSSESSAKPNPPSTSAVP